ncbi:hypothetical protein E3Q22_01350 [Wallemia mellicola]|uniref:Signal peptidase complex subunit 1 n=1 Tax=Wallemia mellicola TaxID=1708541 RepID=A0A4T0NGC3_9BASI|nr:hypothetical protein E3Q24_02755 [Wallemia mellicola]TIB79266.1 hypothetical protein E3Q23_00323 [Wallemia mellicola]TIB81126.1 hypothetical protein E3Q22_01350 [Wallemia mellicola]TIB87427.1 hypothetical protein E3Q21_01336 [Wallemia mellicola]TIB90330.1 hypothetical protein E3Q20_01323 [Wallemia mellicola]
MMETIEKALAGEIDYVGQLKAERLQKIIISATTLISFISGWITSRIEVTAVVYLSGCVIAAIVRLTKLYYIPTNKFKVIGPAWSCYNRNTVQWNDKERKKTE